MANNPYESPSTTALPGRSPSVAFAGLLCTVVSWSLLLVMMAGIGSLYTGGRIGVLANPQFAGLFALAIFAGAPAAFFRMSMAVRVSAVVFSLATLGIWMIYIVPLLRRPRVDDPTGLALGAGVLCFSLAIVVLALLAPNAARRNGESGKRSAGQPRRLRNEFLISDI